MDRRIADALRGVSTPSVKEIRVSSDALLRYPAAYLKAWAAWRTSVVECDNRTPRCRALWYVLDSLLKQAPLLYVPLCSTPEFEAFCVKKFPWDSLDEADVEWPIALVRSWEGLISRGVWTALQQHGATLQARLVMRGAKLGFSSSSHGEVLFASKKELEGLHDSCNVLLSLMASLQQQHLRLVAERQATAMAVSEKDASPQEEVLPASSAAHNAHDDEDDEWEPVFVEGGEL
ncbi:Hypothetical protein, putative, partial [Bodo saltans]